MRCAKRIFYAEGEGREEENKPNKKENGRISARERQAGGSRAEMISRRRHAHDDVVIVFVNILTRGGVRWILSERISSS